MYTGVDFENKISTHIKYIQIQLKLETLKSQGLANITRGIRKWTHPKVLPVIKYNKPKETRKEYKRSHNNILNYVCTFTAVMLIFDYCFVIYLLFVYYILLKIYVHKIIN